MAEPKTKPDQQWAIVAYAKGTKLEAGGTIIAEGTDLDFKATDTLVLRIRGKDKNGRFLQPVEMAVQTARDPWRK